MCDEREQAVDQIGRRLDRRLLLGGRRTIATAIMLAHGGETGAQEWRPEADWQWLWMSRM